MPEYLAPGVYVEEVELGPRPIEGVSTSTTGFVGVARRGPVNKPTLVTNMGEYFRFFGGLLDERTYGTLRWLPYSVVGFFSNGGQRAYIVRVANLPPDDEEAPNPAQFALVASGFLPDAATARRVLASAVDPRRLNAIDLAYPAGLAVGTVIQVGDPPNAEIVRVSGFSDRIEFAPPLSRGYRAGTSVIEMEPGEALSTLAAIPSNMVGATEIRVMNRAPLRTGDWVFLESDVAGESEWAHVANVPGGSGESTLEVAPALAFSHPAGARVTRATAPEAASTTLAVNAARRATSIRLAARGGLAEGSFVILQGNAAGQDEAVRLGAIPAEGDLDVPVTPGLRFAHDNGREVRLLTAQTGETVLVAGIRLAGAAEVAFGETVLIDDGDNSELVRIAGELDDANNVSVEPTLRFPHRAGVDVARLGVPGVTTTTAAASDAGANELRVADEGELTVGDIVELIGGGQIVYNQVGDADDDRITLQRELTYAWPEGAVIRRLTPSMRIIAGPRHPDPELYPEPGSWGNEIRIEVSGSSLGRAALAGAVAQGAPFINLETTNGIEPGTVLRFPDNEYAVVSRVEGNRVFLEGAGAPVAISAGAVADDARPWGREVMTQEFRLSLSWGDADEVFDNLSMDPRHSRYFETIINDNSRLVHVEDLPDVAPPGERLPMTTAEWYLGGGSDGLAGIAPSTFMGEDADNADFRTGLFALLNASRVSIAAVPGQADPAVQLALINHCETARYRFAVLDSGERASMDDVIRQRSLLDSKYAALYYPWIRIFDPITNTPVYAPPSGHVAGLYARTDNELGVHHAPANAVLRQVLDLQFTVGKGQQDILNPLGIDAIRAFPGRGIRVWGARTISSDALWRYINVRRLFIFLEQSIDESTQYVVFEPNDLPLWNRVKASVSAFLTTVWRSGALQGTTEAEAFFVKCGLGETMIQADIDAGRVIILIGVAPVKPAEFVIFRIGQKVGGSEVSE